MSDTKALDTTSVDTAIFDAASRVLTEEDMNRTTDLVALFNWNISKKNVARVMKLNSLYDSVTDQMVRRFEARPDQFSNSDLLDYMKTLQGAIDTSTKNISETAAPPSIVQNNTQINVNVIDSFDRDARARILHAVKATLESAKNIQIPEENIIEVNNTEE